MNARHGMAALVHWARLDPFDGLVDPDCRLRIKTPYYQHRNSHYKDKTVSRLVVFSMSRSSLIVRFMGPTRGRQDPDGSHVGPMNFAIWDRHGSRPGYPEPSQSHHSKRRKLPQRFIQIKDYLFCTKSEHPMDMFDKEVVRVLGVQRYRAPYRICNYEPIYKQR